MRRVTLLHSQLALQRQDKVGTHSAPPPCVPVLRARELFAGLPRTALSAPAEALPSPPGATGPPPDACPARSGARRPQARHSSLGNLPSQPGSHAEDQGRSPQDGRGPHGRSAARRRARLLVPERGGDLRRRGRTRELAGQLREPSRHLAAAPFRLGLHPQRKAAHSIQTRTSIQR